MWGKPFWHNCVGTLFAQTKESKQNLPIGAKVTFFEFRFSGLFQVFLTTVFAIICLNSESFAADKTIGFKAIIVSHKDANIGTGVDQKITTFSNEAAIRMPISNNSSGKGSFRFKITAQKNNRYLLTREFSLRAGGNLVRTVKFRIPDRKSGVFNVCTEKKSVSGTWQVGNCRSVLVQTASLN